MINLGLLIPKLCFSRENYSLVKHLINMKKMCAAAYMYRRNSSQCIKTTKKLTSPFRTYAKTEK